MLKNICLTALRTIFRHRTFSLINLIGLSVSMSLAMLIILIVKEQYAFDNFHRDSERIYRVNTRALMNEGYTLYYASAPLPLGSAISDPYNFSENIVRVNRYFNGEANYGTVTVPMNGLRVDPSFLEVFNFPLQQGNAATALIEPNGLILTHQSAKRMFGTTDPIGQTISISGNGDFIVTGVLQDLPGKTHFEFDMLGSLSALPALEKGRNKKNAFETSVDNWDNYFTNYIYIKLKDDGQVDDAVQALAAISKKQSAGLDALQAGAKSYEFYLQPLSEITPGPELSGQMGSGLPKFVLIFLSTLAGVILLMSIINFTNLMIAKSLSRAREIGVRKVVGAKRFQVFVQFVGETVLFSLIALVFSYGLLQLLKQGYTQLPLSGHFSLDLKEDLILYLIFVVFAVIVGIIAGLLPAGYLSAFRPVNVLKGAADVKIHARLTFRKVLMIAQFTLSIIFVITVLVIYSQIDYMLKADYGFDQVNKLNVNVQSVGFEKLAAEVRGLAGVDQVGGVSYPLGTYNSQSSNYKRNASDESFSMNDLIVDDNYINTIKLTFLAGRNFNPDEQRNDQEKDIILNEKALSNFGFADPVSVIDHLIYMNDSIPLRVIGVVKDFHARPLDSQIAPMGLRYNLKELKYLSAQINPIQKEAVIASLHTTWKKYDSDSRLDYKMMEEEIDGAYRESGMQDFLMILGYITFLAVTLACLGMLGMAMYATHVRAKEVGVRKVMGASVTDVVIVLSKSFMMLIGIAILIGTPVSFLIGNLFLDTFSSHIAITPVLIATGVALIAGLGLLIVCSQTIKTALANPVKTLRYE